MRIGGFLAFDGEADPLELMSVAVASGKQVFVPIVTGKSKPLLFAPWRPEIQLQPNRFGIPEPVGVKTEWRLASELDFVIHPLVAFDNSCGRIGVGGGFYDRSFAFLNEPNVNKKDDAQKIHLVGFAFELQKIPSIDIQPWDVRLTDVVTESARYTSPDVGGV